MVLIIVYMEIFNTTKISFLRRCLMVWVKHIFKNLLYSCTIFKIIICGIFLSFAVQSSHILFFISVCVIKSRWQNWLFKQRKWTPFIILADECSISLNAKVHAFTIIEMLAKMMKPEPWHFTESLQT